MIRAEHLNYQHLRYFWAVVQEGGVSAAAARLHVSQPTISSQMRKLERAIGGKLLERRGRTVAPTPLGKLVFDHADRIFAIGQDLVDSARVHATQAPVRFVVGATDALPKLVVRSLVAGLLQQKEPRIHLVVREGKPEQLMADLAVHRIDLALCDRDIVADTGVRAYSHPLGGSPVGLFARPEAAERLRVDFPASLENAPTMLPSEGAALRAKLETWFSAQGIAPEVTAEFDDSALMKTCAEHTDGVWPGPIALQGDLQEVYGAELIAEVPGVREEYFAVSLERRVQTPAVRLMLEASPFKTHSQWSA